MGRELKRVPINFNYPLGKVWYGYYDKYFNFCHSEYSAGCEGCKAYARIKGIEINIHNDGTEGCPKFEEFYNLPDMSEKVEPPEGEGYQLWETTSEGSPISPVFKTFEELCEWCEAYATTFGSFSASKKEWKEMLSNNFVFHKQGNVIFL